MLAIICAALTSACATRGATHWGAAHPDAVLDVLVDLKDPSGDVRLRHPAAPGVEKGTFDLRRLVVRRLDDHIEVAATFAVPPRPLAPLPDDVDRNRPWFLPTVDVYLNLVAGKGEARALPGRAFFLPSEAAWDAALILGPGVDTPAGVVWNAEHLVTTGRTLRGRFPLDAIQGEVISALVVVLATSPRATGQVRAVGVLKGDCSTWDDARCQLDGQGPPVLDATGPVSGDVIAASPLGVSGESIPDAGAPAASAAASAPVAFYGSGLVVASPIAPELARTLTLGVLATLQDSKGNSVGTAVVESLASTAVSMRVIGAAPASAPTSVVFAAAGGGATPSP